MLRTAALEDVASYWQDNFDELMKLDAGGKHKQADMARGKKKITLESPLCRGFCVVNI